MSSQLTAYIALICTSGVFNLYLSVYTFVKRHHYSNIVHFFILNAVVTTIYCFAAAFGLLSTTLEQIKYWTSLQYVGIAFGPPFGLLFITQYLGLNIAKKWIGAFLAVPFVTLLLVATNDWHHLHYRVFELDPVLGAPFVQQEMGNWYMIHGVFIFACMFVAFLFALSRWNETAKAYRPQLIALLCGQLVPMLTAFVYLLGVTPPGIDPVPMVLWLTSILYFWAISSSRMFSIMPIAKDTIFQSINDGVMVLDASSRFIEFNQACKRMFPPLHKSMLGQNFEQVWFTLTGESLPFALESVESMQELQLTTEKMECIYQVRTSLVKQANNKIGMLIIFTDITELKKLQVKLEHQAYYDELTQIYNRRAFFELCEQDFVSAKQDSSTFTIVLLDIDYFKNINDTYGHYVGDQMLVQVVKVVQSQLKRGQLFARFGGEEFVLALKDYTLAEGEALANQLRKEMESQPLITKDGGISVTLSFGVAEATGEPNETLVQLLNKGDKALYAAKQQGRNQVRAYTGT